MIEQSFGHDVDVNRLYRRHIALARGRAMRLLGDAQAAQEVAEEAFIKLLDHGERRGSDEELAAFVYRTVTNLALNRLREGVRQKELSALRATNPALASQSKDHGNVSALREILALVSYDEAQIAAYFYVDGLEEGEIADLLGIEVRTVGKRLTCFDERALRLVSVTMQVKYVA